MNVTQIKFAHNIYGVTIIAEDFSANFYSIFNYSSSVDDPNYSAYIYSDFKNIQCISDAHTQRPVSCLL
jgi:hypothetical protein